MDGYEVPRELNHYTEIPTLEWKLASSASEGFQRCWQMDVPDGYSCDLEIFFEGVHSQIHDKLAVLGILSFRLTVKLRLRTEGDLAIN